MLEIEYAENCKCLVSQCMAWHWFDNKKEIQRYNRKKI